MNLLTRPIQAPPAPAADRQPLLPGLTAAALVVLVLISPWLPGWIPLLSAVVAVLWGFLTLTRWHMALPVPLLVAAGIPLVQVLSLPFALDPQRSLVLIVVSLLGWTTAAAIVAVGPRRARWVLTAASASLVLVSVQSLTGLGDLTSHSGGSVVSGRLQGPFAQPNELGAYAVLLLPAVIAAASLTRRVSTSLVLWLTTLPAFAALALSLSRGSWLATLAALLILALLLPRAGAVLTLLATAGGVALVGAATHAPAGTAGVLLDRIGSLDDPGASPDDHRPFIWDLTLRVAREHPVLGVGPGGIETAAIGADSPMSIEPPLHAHNLPLTVLAENGVVGLAVALALGVVLCMSLQRCVRSRELGWADVGALTGLCGAAVHGLIDMPWRNPTLTLTAWVLFGVLAAGWLSTHPGRSPLRAPPHPDVSTRPSERSAMSLTEPTERRSAETAKKEPVREPVTPDSSRQADPRPRRSWVRRPVLPAAFAVLATAALILLVSLLPTLQEASAVVGLRSETGESGQVIGSDEMRLITQQYSVALSSDVTVDRAVDELGLGAEASADADVDPDTTTVRIVARADSAEEATQLADQLVTTAADRADEDPQVSLVRLSEPSAEHAEPTVSKPLLLGAGLVVIVVLTIALETARRRW